jgi:hypothetical protein
MTIAQAREHAAQVAAEREHFNAWWQWEIKSARMERMGPRIKFDAMLTAWRAWLCAKGLQK